VYGTVYGVDIYFKEEYPVRFNTLLSLTDMEWHRFHQAVITALILAGEHCVFLKGADTTALAPLSLYVRQKPVGLGCIQGFTLLG